MAGGTFDPLAGKVRPGTYINFQLPQKGVTGNSERGIVVMPLIGHSYGAEREFITLTNVNPDAEYAKLGYSIYEDDPALNMLLIREAFKNAQKVIVYNPKVGIQATATGGGITGTAKYGGTRGNSLSYSVVANPVGGFDVTVYLAGNTVSVYEGLTTAAQLIEKGDAYIVFTGSGDLSATAGVSLTGGTNVAPQNSDITAFLDGVEGVKFNTLCFPVTDATLQAACKAKIKYLRENVGKGVKAVVPDFNSDYEGILNVTNAVVVEGKTLTHAQACAWVAGADAAATNIQSNTYLTYGGATDIVDKKTNEEAIAAIQNGEFFFSWSEAGAVVVEYDINSLVTFTGKKDQAYRKNRVLRVFDTFAEAVSLNFPPNKYDNSPDGWDIMEGIGRTILKRFADVGAIKNVDYEADFVVDRGKSTGDETYFNVGLEAVDSAEKLYFTISTR
jgi:hypothetical protein